LVEAGKLSILLALGASARGNLLIRLKEVLLWCRVALVRRCFLPPDAAPRFVHLHHGRAGSVSLGCFGTHLPRNRLPL